MALLEHRNEIPPGFFLASCAVSGGSLEYFLQEALTVSNGQLCMELAPCRMDFTLPCTSGIGVPISASQLEAEKGAFHFSQCLGTNYLTYLSGDTLHCTFFDTIDSLSYKLAVCETIGIPKILLPDRALRRKLCK